MGIFDKAKDLLAQHGDQVDQGIDKAAQFIDEKTGLKHSERIDGVADTVKDKLDEFSGEQPPAAGTTPPPAAH